MPTAMQQAIESYIAGIRATGNRPSDELITRIATACDGEPLLAVIVALLAMAHSSIDVANQRMSRRAQA
jgi:hypothetical protein